MTARSKLILATFGLLAFLWLLGATSKRVYFEPRAKLDADIDSVSRRVDAYRGGIDDARRVQREIDAFVERTLGGDLETVDHRLRTCLNRLAEQLQLADVVVGTGRAVSRQSPARRKFSRRDKALRDEIDFIELNAWITATGTLDQALRLADAIEHEPWIKRIDQWRLDPRNNGERILTTVRLTTLFLPGRDPHNADPPPYDGAGFARYETLAAINPFRVPDAPPPAAPEPVAPVPGADLAPWVITGIAETARGVEVWLLNTITKQTRILRAGDALDSLVLVEAGRDRAVVEHDGARYILQVGEKLNDTSRPAR